MYNFPWDSLLWLQSPYSIQFLVYNVLVCSMPPSCTGQAKETQVVVGSMKLLHHPEGVQPASSLDLYAEASATSPGKSSYSLVPPPRAKSAPIVQDGLWGNSCLCPQLPPPPSYAPKTGAKRHLRPYVTRFPSLITGHCI